MAETLSFPLQFVRQFSGPLDRDNIKSTVAEATTYLSNPLCYAGQPLAILETEKLYVVKSDKSALIEIATLSGVNQLIDDLKNGVATEGNTLKKLYDLILEKDHYKGEFLSLEELQLALPTARKGDFADVNPGEGVELNRYYWDDEDGWVTNGGGSPTIGDNSVTNVKLADMAENTIKGRQGGIGEGDPQDLTPGQVRNIITDTGNQFVNQAEKDVIANEDKTYKPWAEDTLYRVGATVSHDGGYYIAKTEHTSGASFDASKFDLNLTGDFPEVSSQFLFPEIDSTTGLKAIPTVGLDLGAHVFYRDANASLKAWKLVSGNDAESDSVKIPNDYDSVTNQKVWKIANTGGGLKSANYYISDNLDNSDEIMFEGVLSTLSIVKSAAITTVSYAVKVDDGVYTNQANLANVQTWINANVSSNTLWWLKIIGNETGSVIFKYNQA